MPQFWIHCGLRLRSRRFHGIDHLPRRADGHDIVLSAVKRPKWQCGEATRLRWIAAAAKGRNGRQPIGSGDSEFPRPVTAHAIARDVNSVRINRVSLDDVIKKLEKFRGVPTGVRRTLRRDDDHGKVPPLGDKFGRTGTKKHLKIVAAFTSAVEKQ